MWQEKQPDHAFLYHSPPITDDVFCVSHVYLLGEKKGLVNICNFGNILHLLHVLSL